MANGQKIKNISPLKDEAVQMWNGGVALLGTGDVKMLEFKKGEKA